MALAELSISLRRQWSIRAIVVLLLPHLIGLLGIFPYYTLPQGSIGLRVFAVGIALVTLLALAGLWRQGRGRYGQRSWSCP